MPWLISTLVLTSLGFYMYPHAFLATYSARSVRAIRRNATWLPLYQLLLLPLFYVGFTALLVAPGLTGGRGGRAGRDGAGQDPIFGLNAGIVALAANAAVTVVGSLLLPARPEPDVLAAYAAGPVPVTAAATPAAPPDRSA